MTSRRTFLGGLGLGPLAAAVPARAQQGGRIARVGYVSSSTTPTENARATLERLQELGWVEGRNLTLELRFVGPDRGRLMTAMKEMADLGVDLILTGGGAEAPQLAKSATKTIPIVFAMADDPVRLGLVRNLARPEGNITGVSSMNAELDAKRLELLREILPNLKRVGVMWSPVDPSGAAVMSAAEAAARSLNLQLEPLPVDRAEDLTDAFADARKRGVDAVAVLGTPILFVHQRRIGELASAARMPIVSGWRQLPEAGGLLSYGADLREMFRRAAEIADMILKGAKPAAIPVERPKGFDLVVNLKVARSLGLRIPQAVLLRATNVIE
jgi:putative tryptophan/tyrosine transport system substrate-binding protein